MRCSRQELPLDSPRPAGAIGAVLHQRLQVYVPAPTDCCRPLPCGVRGLEHRRVGLAVRRPLLAGWRVHLRA
jgi:hypothetical protein